MTKKITHEEYLKHVAEMGSGITVVGTYINALTNITHRCAEGHEWEAAPNEIKRGRGCAKCSGNKKITHEEYVKSVTEMGNGITVIGTYTGRRVKINHRCAKGHEWLVKPYKIRDGRGCPECRKGSTEEYTEWLEQDGRGFVALEPYVSRRSKISHRCAEGHEWEATSSNIKLGSGCPKCSLSATDANVFYIWENSSDAGVYKVGITSERCAEDRIAICTRKNSMEASVILIASVPNAREIEQKALEMGESADYSSEIDGYTEFRRYTDQELGEVYRMAVQAA